MNNWIDWSFMNDVLHLVDPDIWHLFGVDPKVAQYGLVVILVLSLTWVVRPVVEWLMIKHWAVLSTFLTCSAITVVFLQVVDRYAMSQEHTALPASYWTICLLAIGTAGFIYLVQQMMIHAWKRKKRKASKRVA